MSETASGVIFAALAATSWASGAVLARVGMTRIGSTTGTFISLVSGFLVTLVIALVIDFDALWAISLGTMGMFAILGSIQFPLGRFLNFNAIRLVGVAPASAVLGASPLFAATLALLFLDETLTLTMAVGITAVVAGLALVLTERRA